MDSVILSASSYMVQYNADCITHHPSAKGGMFTGISLQEFYFRDPGDPLGSASFIWYWLDLVKIRFYLKKVI